MLEQLEGEHLKIRESLEQVDLKRLALRKQELEDLVKGIASINNGNSNGSAGDRVEEEKVQVVE